MVHFYSAQPGGCILFILAMYLSSSFKVISLVNMFPYISAFIVCPFLFLHACAHWKTFRNSVGICCHCLLVSCPFWRSFLHFLPYADFENGAICLLFFKYHLCLPFPINFFENSISFFLTFFFPSISFISEP